MAEHELLRRVKLADKAIVRTAERRYGEADRESPACPNPTRIHELRHSASILGKRASFDSLRRCALIPVARYVSTRLRQWGREFYGAFEVRTGCS